MNFMKNDKEERERERENDKEELRQLISGVKSDVEAAIKPIKEKQAELEVAHADIQKGFSDLVAEVKDMQKQLANQAHIPPTQENQPRNGPMSYSQAAQVAVGRHAHDHHVQAGEGEVVKESIEDKLGSIVSLGRRTVGLFKINKENLTRMRKAQYGGAK